MEFLLSFALTTSVLGIICLILDYEPNKKKEYIDNIPSSKKKSSILDKPAVKDFVANALKANGKDDSIEKLTKDLFMSGIIGIMLMAIFATIGQFPVGIFVGILSLALPFLTRTMGKKSFKKKYLKDFYEFLNYMILHVSGGVPVDKALIEVEKLINEKSLIKKRLQNIIAQRAINGLVGNTYVDALKDLNKDLDYSEINSFIAAARRTTERGDSIVETLMEQLEDIQKKSDMDKRAKITSAETMFNAYQVVFCLVPVLMLFILPIFISSIMQLSIF